MSRSKKTNYLVKIALLAAAAFVLMYIEVPMPFVPPWLKLDFSDVPALLGAFAMGPLAGVIIEAIKVVLFFIFKNSQTAGIGEMANFIMGIAFVLPTAIIYLKHKTRKSALIGLAVGAAAMGLSSFVLNYWVLIPAYSLFLMPMDVIIDMCKAVNPSVDSLAAISVASMLFTLLKCVIDGVIIFLLYKKLSPVLHK